MASLRKKPEPDAEAVIAPPVAVAVDHSSAPDAASDVLRSQLGALRTAEELHAQQAAAMQAAEQRRAEWFRSSPAAQANQAALNPLHQAAIDSGLVDTSPDYFNFMESQLAALAQHPAAATHIAEQMQRHAIPEEPPPPEPERRVPVSAPVSREVPNYSGQRERSGRITLSPAEIEHARVAGISVQEYAKQKLRYGQLRESGQYGGDQR